MRAWSYVRSIPGRLRTYFAANPSVPAGSPPWAFSSAPGSPFVGAWTDNRVEQVRHFRHWTYVAIDRIASTVAKARPHISVARDPLDLLLANPTPQAGLKGPTTRYCERMLARSLAPMQTDEQLEPVPFGHPLGSLLRGVNYEDTGFDLWYDTVMFLLLTGSSYWWVPRNALGLPSEIWCLPSHWVWPIPAKTPGSQLIGAYRIRPTEGSYTGLELPADEVIHFKRRSPLSKFDGYSPTSAGSRWIDAAESVDKTRWFVFRNGPMPQVVIQFNGAMPSNEVLDRIELRIQQRYAGEHNAGKPLLIPPGAEAKPLWITPKELDFRSSFEQLRDSTLALYGVPAVVAGITKNMTYGSVRAAQVGFCVFTVNPLLSYIGQVITEKLASIYDPNLRVWWPDQSPEDPAMVEQELRTDIQAGAVTINEIRARRGRHPVPNGDVLVQPPGRPEPKAKRRAFTLGPTEFSE